MNVSICHTARNSGQRGRPHLSSRDWKFESKAELLSFKEPESVECMLQAMCYYCGTEEMLIARVKPVLQSLLDSEGVDRQIRIRDTEGFIEVNRDLSTVSSLREQLQISILITYTRLHNNQSCHPDLETSDRASSNSVQHIMLQRKVVHNLKDKAPTAELTQKYRHGK